MSLKKPILKNLSKAAIICSLFGVWGCSTLPSASSAQTPKEAAQQSYNLLLENSFNYESKGSSKIVQDTTKKAPKREEPAVTEPAEPIDLNDSDDVESTLDSLINPTDSDHDEDCFSYSDAVGSFLKHVMNNSSSTAKGAFYPKELKMDGFIQTDLKMRNIQASLNIPYAINMTQQTVKIGLYDLMPILGKKGAPYQDKAVLVTGKDYKELSKVLGLVTQNWNKIIGATQDSWTQIDPKAFTDQPLTSADRSAGGQRKVRFAPTKENIEQALKGIDVGMGDEHFSETATEVLDALWPEEITGVYFDFVLNRQGQLVKLDQTMNLPMTSFFTAMIFGNESNATTQVSQSTTLFSNYGRAKPVFNPKDSDLVSARKLQSIITRKSTAQIEADEARRASYEADEAAPIRRAKVPKAKPKATSTKGKKKAGSKAK